MSIGHIALSWSAPSSSGGSNVFRYDLYRDGSGTPIWTGNAFSHTDVVGNGQTHVYRVTAVNAVGSSAYSSPAVGGTTPNVPGTPIVVATGGLHQIVLAWAAPPNNGMNITRYDIYRGGSFLASTATPGYTNAGLGNGAPWTYSVKAVNAVGASAGGSASATTWDVPSAPVLNPATAGDGSVGLTWSIPANNGSPITLYNIFRGGSPLGTSATPSFTDNTVTNGVTYSYTVTAHNGVGDSVASNPVSATPAGLPSAPVLNPATAGDGSVGLTWSIPANNGSPITLYNIFRGGSPLGTSATPSFTDNTVTNGVTYSYTVTAHNGVGDSVASNPVSATPVGAPGAPRSPSVSSPGTDTVDFSWLVPTSNGGSAITGYNIYRGTSSGSETLYVTGWGGSPYQDVAATSGTQWFYYVTAVNANGESVGSAEVSITP